MKIRIPSVHYLVGSTAGYCAVLLLLGLVLVIFTTPIAAEESRWRISGGLTSTLQSTSIAEVDPEVLTSFDLVIQRLLGPGDLRVYFEGNTTPRANGVSSFLPESNADAGSALNKDGKGRVQISELAYHHVFNTTHEITLGLIDITGYFDHSRIASDENTQFLGASFVQNPTIDFPDYTLGGVYEYTPNEAVAVRFGLTSSNGLADNPDLSYSQLLDIGEHERGIFAIGAVAWKKGRWLVRTGLWTNTASHEALDGTRGDMLNLGAFAMGGFQSSFGTLNTRLGIANNDVSRAAEYIGITYQKRQGPVVFGLGLGETFVSRRDPRPDAANTLHIEGYTRWDLSKILIVTGNIQHLNNANLDGSVNSKGKEVTVYGLRLTFLIE